MKTMMLTAGLLCLASLCGAESGSINLCRTAHGRDGSYLHKPVKLPAGLRFVDAGNAAFPNVRNNGRPVSIALTKEVTIADSNQCVIANAEVSRAPENYRIVKTDGRIFRPDFIDNRVDLIATIASDFK